MRITPLPDNETACSIAAHELAYAIIAAVNERGSAHVVLAGGSTPRRAYELLAPLIADWSGVSLWYGDERCVGADDPDANHRMVAESLLAGIADPSHGTPVEHRVRTELSPQDAAAAYGRLVRELVGAGEPGIPVFDVALLGLGEDGHTASLFPGRELLHETAVLCAAVHDAPKPPPDRVTLTVPVLRAARLLVILATGAAKADALAAIALGPSDEYPASLLDSDRMHVICDYAAAGRA